jgi:hypothetical protein
MSADKRDVFVYLLIDNGLLQEVPVNYVETEPQSRPGWLEPIYPERALEVSPLLMDVEAAYEAGKIDEVMGYLNAHRPALHVSIIESGLRLAEIARHLRRFIFVLDPDAKQFTLRFADCAILEQLPSVLTPSQWAVMRGPFARWGMHDRLGSVIQLPPNESGAHSPTPLRLDRDQLAALDEASEPDHLIAKVRMMRHGAKLPGTAAEQHAWAREAQRAWQAAHHSNPLFLLFLAEAVLLCQGKILRIPDIKDALAMDDARIFRQRLQGIMRGGCEGFNSGVEC